MVHGQYPCAIYLNILLVVGKVFVVDVEMGEMPPLLDQWYQVWGDFGFALFSVQFRGCASVNLLYCDILLLCVGYHGTGLIWMVMLC